MLAELDSLPEELGLGADGVDEFHVPLPDLGVHVVERLLEWDVVVQGVDEFVWCAVQFRCRRLDVCVLVRQELRDLTERNLNLNRDILVDHLTDELNRLDLFPFEETRLLEGVVRFKFWLVLETSRQRTHLSVQLFAYSVEGVDVCRVDVLDRRELEFHLLDKRCPNGSYPIWVADDFVPFDVFALVETCEELDGRCRVELCRSETLTDTWSVDVVLNDVVCHVLDAGRPVRI